MVAISPCSHRSGSTAERRTTRGWRGLTRASRRYVRRAHALPPRRTRRDRDSHHATSWADYPELRSAIDSSNHLHAISIAEQQGEGVTHRRTVAEDVPVAVDFRDGGPGVMVTSLRR